MYLVVEDWHEDYLPDVIVGVFSDIELAWKIAENIMEGMSDRVQVNVLKLELNKVYVDCPMEYVGKVERKNYELGQYEIVRVKNA